MFEKPRNQRTVTVSMSRTDLCHLMLACTIVAVNGKKNGGTVEKWIALHDRLMNVLDQFDKKLDEEVVT